jgi:DNA polymerase III epsilon subunit-like protein
LTKTDKILELSKSNPNLSTREVAEEVGCTRRLARMVRNEYSTEVTAKKAPKILIFDIETAPMEVFVWGLYKQQIPIQNVIKDFSLLSWSAKWLFEPEIMSAKVTGWEAKNREDGSIVEGLWSLLDEADMVVGHNVNKFDVRKANLRFHLNGLKPPMPYRTIDTMKHAMRVFGSSSYKMDYLNKIFGLSMKKSTTYDLWVRCVHGDEKALAQMLDYNQFDVTVTEELYLSLRPWMKSHPNVALYIDTEETICTNCGNEDLDWAGFYYTPAGKYKAFRCGGCGAVGRSRTSNLTKEERAKLLLSIAS